ncbi:glutamate-gated chloride channel-like [Mercenaria mercenaria]|uniref:glutamate-gated chloride channel-like n=1 Tax=Mercenaria mercenaria TaxID=6596 RepID=UPI00234F9D52|nr:glutamate-gated chloride channel-like [Mercenaria mercenaria]
MFSRIANTKMEYTFYAVSVCSWILFVFHVPFISCEGNESTTTPTRSDMIHYLLNRNDYDSNLPPGLKDTSVKPTDVHVQLSIYDLNSESDVNMEYECTMYMRVNWVDSRLSYAANNTNYTTLKLSSADVGKIWIPDLFFHHERHSEIHALLSENVLVYIYENGSVQYSVRVNTRSHCEMNLKQYPFDTQACPVIIQSYAYTADYIIFYWLGDPPVIIDNADHLSLEPGSTKSGFWLPYNALGSYLCLNTIFMRSLSFCIGVLPERVEERQYLIVYPYQNYCSKVFSYNYQHLWPKLSEMSYYEANLHILSEQVCATSDFGRVCIHKYKVSFMALN